MTQSADRAVNATSIQALIAELDSGEIGRELVDRIGHLYPICRSITGNGLRETLRQLATEIDLVSVEVASGTKVFDWTIPQEWNITDAYIKDSRGTRVVDFRAYNLHVVNSSVPVHARMPLADLRRHLFSIPEHPEWIPYKTSYYSPNWGFCLSHRQLESLRDETYEVCIDSSIQDGHLTFAECVLPGTDSDEVLISCHACHPSLCNDNLSGVSIAATLARLLGMVPRRLTYRFLFVPGTIGAITWLALRQERTRAVRHGLVLACLGDAGPSTYKQSRRGNADIDRAVAHVLQQSGAPFEIKPFSPYGYDERQYCSPGFNLPVGVLSRTPHGCFPEYHTSADGLSFVRAECLADSLIKCLKIVSVLEGNHTYMNRNPYAEPQLGRRGLYSAMGGHGDDRTAEAALLWVLNQSDGTHSLLDIAERSGLSFDAVQHAAALLARHELLEQRRDTE